MIRLEEIKQSVLRERARRLNEWWYPVEGSSTRGTNYDDRDTIVWSYVRGQNREWVVGGSGDTHEDILREYQKEGLVQKGLGRFNLEYEGRGWRRKKEMSFWTFPESKSRLMWCLENVREEYNRRVSEGKVYKGKQLNSWSGWNIVIPDPWGVKFYGLTNDGGIWEELSDMVDNSVNKSQDNPSSIFYNKTKDEALEEFTATVPIEQYEGLEYKGTSSSRTLGHADKILNQ